MTLPTHLSFPPGTLAENALRLAVLHAAAGAVMLEKNAGIAEIGNAFRAQIAEGKPSACAFGLRRPQLVFAPEAEISGLQIYADKDSEALDLWKNTLGSALFRFRYTFLTRPVPNAARESEITCSLPVAQHVSKPLALISHTTGKKSETHFRRVEMLSGFELWEAETAFPRFHQIRLHAKECGLPIVGDALYDGVPAPRVSELRPKKRLNKGEDKPLYAPICLHLRAVELPDRLPGIEAFSIEAPLPNGFETLLKKLRARI